MRGLRFRDIESKPFVVLDMTSLVAEEFRALVEPFEEQFQAHMAKWRLDGLPRTKRSYSTYKNCPLPTPEDRLFFILAYLKNNPLQTLHGCTFGLPQCKANIWIHVLFPVLQNTFRHLGYAPSRSLRELAKRLHVPLEQTAQMVSAHQVDSQKRAQEGPETISPPQEGGPLFVMMVPREPSHAPRTRMIRSSITVERKRDIR